MSRMHCTRARSGAPRSLAAVIMPSALSISRARRAPSRGAAPGRPRALGRAPAGRRARSLAKFRARATRRAAARKKSHRQGDARRPSATRAPRRRRAHSLGPPRVRDEMRVRSDSGMSRRPWPRVALQRRRGGSAPKIRRAAVPRAASLLHRRPARARARAFGRAGHRARARGGARRARSRGLGQDAIFHACLAFSLCPRAADPCAAGVPE